MAAAAAATVSLCSSRCPGLSLGLGLPQARLASQVAATPLLVEGRRARRRRGWQVAATEGSAKSSGEAEEQVPSWARPGSDEPPPWARDGGGGGGAQEPGVQLPFYAYLLASAITAIAAIGSIFEYANQRPVFGVVSPDSALYAPLLGFFVFTGIPTSGFLWFKAVQTANKEAEEQDRRDGFS
ncbi:hypothetical protein GUJ93_ZPchr0005g15058 [Zizania palustris]|uniref:Uncharacterized protein n=1 Tax=Zizania palustris TaxID=103762 RepID=A0A8J5REU6_ZIZPA|nr:hypothetical protein GUJ93_ZPchr0067g6544 [Zizania palustris]KAG8068224.1 hypothetical protein GUJ93_ZPchr0005g15058 [Zizania palustris]KAG8068226.1 hypothetical protein GUJ93_ZPchr0005g15058 [Zizania palustris]